MGLLTELIIERGACEMSLVDVLQGCADSQLSCSLRRLELGRCCVANTAPHAHNSTPLYWDEGWQYGSPGLRVAGMLLPLQELVFALSPSQLAALGEDGLRALLTPVLDNPAKRPSALRRLALRLPPERESRVVPGLLGGGSARVTGHPGPMLHRCRVLLLAQYAPLLDIEDDVNT